MLANIIAWIATNFSFAMYLLAAFMVMVHRLIIGHRLSEYEIVYRWTALLPLGIASMYSFIVHVFFPVISAVSIGWPQSPFQFEVGMANLSIGVIAIMSFKKKYNFRLATVIAATCWLWGDAIGHIYQIMMAHDFQPGNAGSWLWMDIIVPLVLVICVSKLKPHVAYH